METSSVACAKFILSNIGSWDERRLRHAQLLEALATLVLEHPEKAETGFTTFEVHQAVSDLIKKPWGDPDAAPKTVSKAWGKLEELWDTKKEGLRQRAKDTGLGGYPRIEKKTGGGGGISSLYILSTARFPSSDEVTEPNGDTTQPGKHEIRYYLDDLEKPGFIARSFSRGFLLKGWRKVFFLIVQFSILIGLIALLWSIWDGIEQAETTGKSLSLLLTAGFFIWMAKISLGAFIEILDWDISIAPYWLQNSGTDEDRLLLFQRNQPGKPNEIKLARFTGKCPICDGAVLIRHGGKAFPDRLVGRCKNSPREHIYSFDHHLRRGTLLYSGEHR